MSDQRDPQTQRDYDLYPSSARPSQLHPADEVLEEKRNWNTHPPKPGEPLPDYMDLNMNGLRDEVRWLRERVKELETLLSLKNETANTFMNQVRKLQTALAESVKLQSHYAGLLNQYDGGKRMQFDSPEVWIKRLKETEERANDGGPSAQA